MSLLEKYRKEIVPSLQKEFGLASPYAVPTVEKISVNVGIGTYTRINKDYQPIIQNIARITGQRPIVTKARKAVSAFKVRENMPVGVCVTLRGKRKFDFLDKLINIVFPRVRDFKGLSTKSFNKQGDYTVGLPDYTVFPEINPEDIVQIHGLQIVISTTTSDPERSKILLEKIGMPFKKEKEKINLS